MTSKLLCAAVLMALSGSALALEQSQGEGRAARRAPGQVQSDGTAPAPAPAEHRTASSAALGAVPGDQFSVRESFVDPVLGVTVVRVDRTYKGLPVIGGDAVQHFRGSELKNVRQTLATTGRPNTRARITADQAIVNAGVQFGTGFQGVPTARLVVYALGAAPQLAYEVVFTGTKADQTPTEMHYFVDARDGRILNKWDTVQTANAAGSAKTLYSGTVALNTNSISSGFELRDPTRGNNYTINGHTGKTSGLIFKDSDNAWGDGTMADAATVATEAQFGIAVTWDYFKNVLERRGIAGNNRGSYNRVHFGVKYSNAYWSDGCFCMTFGDGDGVNIGPLVALDIAGHEMSHGVTSRTAGLVYSGESGGLNEATSDIFGTMVEFYANNAIDTPDYLIGEEIMLANVSGSATQKALRYMFDPFRDGKSPNCYVSTLGNIDVHYSSGVANRFFYLLAEGSGARTYSGVNHMVPTCNGGSVTGIGRDKAAKVWYRALTMYMTSGSNYAVAAAATIAAVDDLYGNTSPEHAAVLAAWAAVSVTPGQLPPPPPPGGLG